MKTIYLPAETFHIPFEELAHLIADALWPETGPDDPRENYGFSRVGLDSELELAVKNGTLPVKNPLTFGPHTYPVGNALRSALVTVDDLRGFVAERGLSVLVEAPEQAAPAHSDEKARAQVQYMLMLSNSLKNSVSPEQAEKVAKLDEVSRALSLGDTNPTEAPRPVASPAPAAPAVPAPLAPRASDTPVVAETVEQRRARWLDMYEAEQKREMRGALQRLADSENVDRSNMKKDIEKARVARDTERRAGTWTSQIVQDGKRKG